MAIERADAFSAALQECRLAYVTLYRYSKEQSKIFETGRSAILIPKIVHFVWVGSAPKPELVQRCMASWSIYCPDYQIVEWGNEALSDIDNDYVIEAAADGKWAFVSDYIRLMALYEMGGFYFDSDLEITAPLDAFRTYDFLTGFERTLDGRRVRPITALMASVPGDPIIGSLLKEYEGLHFMKNGVPDQTTNTDRITRHFRRNYGLAKSHYRKGEDTVFLDEKSVIFPSHFFCTPKPGEENYSIHHFSGSWIQPGKRKIIASFGNWQILKFTFRPGESATLPLVSDERLICKFSSGVKKKRALALVRRRAD